MHAPWPWECLLSEVKQCQSHPYVRRDPACQADACSHDEIEGEWNQPSRDVVRRSVSGAGNAKEPPHDAGRAAFGQWSAACDAPTATRGLFRRDGRNIPLIESEAADI